MANGHQGEHHTLSSGPPTPAPGWVPLHRGHDHSGRGCGCCCERLDKGA